MNRVTADDREIRGKARRHRREMAAESRPVAAVPCAVGGTGTTRKPAAMPVDRFTHLVGSGEPLAFAEVIGELVELAKEVAPQYRALQRCWAPFRATSGSPHRPRGLWRLNRTSAR